MKRMLPPNLSVWYHLDSFVCGLTVFGSFLLMVVYRYVAWLFCGALLTAVLLRFLPWLYSRDYPHSTPFLIITAAIRALLWTAAIGGLALPFLLPAIQQRWAYPFQRALFLSNYRSDSIVCTLLPETLPDKTEQYSVRMVPAMGQGPACVDLSFRTDTEGEYVHHNSLVNADVPFVEKLARCRRAVRLNADRTVQFVRDLFFQKRQFGISILERLFIY